MIHEEICTYEVAKLAKKKGFNVPTFGYYRIDTEDWYRTDVYDDWNDSTIRYSAPTQSLLQRWLREEKNVDIEITPEPSHTTESKRAYMWATFCNSDGYYYDAHSCDEEYYTYEHALEDALKYVLKNLV